jgi:DNA-binding NarL/FixJ family response regulator
MIVLLMFKPRPVRDGLSALLNTIPDVKLVVHAHDPSAVLEFCRKNQNILIILEIKPGDCALLAQVPDMKAHCPQGQIIALIHDEDDRGAAEQVGMELIVNVGTRAPVLKAQIEDVVRELPTLDTHDSQRWLG